MYTQYYNILETRIKSNLNTIKTVGWFNNQYTRNEKLKAMAFPGVFIEFDNPTIWDTAGNGLQTANTSITFHLAYFDVADKPVNTLNLANELHKLLHLFTLVTPQDKIISSALVRTSSSLLSEYDQLKVVKLTYACTLFDDSAIEEQTSVTPTLNTSFII